MTETVVFNTVVYYLQQMYSATSLRGEANPSWICVCSPNCRSDCRLTLLRTTQVDIVETLPTSSKKMSDPHMCDLVTNLVKQDIHRLISS